VVYGLGMLVADEIRTWVELHPHSVEVGERIECWFEPHPAIELKVKICESALFHAFIDPTHPAAGRAEFLRYWLRMQNASSAAYDAFASYILRAPQEFIKVAEQMFTADTELGSGGAVFLRVFLQIS